MPGTKTGPWKERHFFDLWSIVHLFTGFAIGGGFVYLGTDPYIACAIAVGIFTIWEIMELFANIHEEGANRVTDVIVDYGGFFLAQLYAYAWGKEMHWYIPVSAAIIAAVLQTIGVVDHFKRRKK